jgi:hypothetical protein
MTRVIARDSTSYRKEVEENSLSFLGAYRGQEARKDYIDFRRNLVKEPM